VGIGAIFILVVVAIVLAVGAALLLGVVSALRRGKMHPEGDKVEGGGQGGEESAQQRGRRPEHVRVSTEQRTRFIAHR
jgi:hypothetical protein